MLTSPAFSVGSYPTHEGPGVRAGSRELSLREVKSWILQNQNKQKQKEELIQKYIVYFEGKNMY